MIPVTYHINYSAWIFDIYKIHTGSNKLCEKNGGFFYSYFQESHWGQRRHATKKMWGWDGWCINVHVMNLINPNKFKFMYQLVAKSSWIVTFLTIQEMGYWIAANDRKSDLMYSSYRSSAECGSAHILDGPRIILWWCTIFILHWLSDSLLVKNNHIIKHSV